MPPVQTALWAVAQQLVARSLGDRTRPGRAQSAAGVACIAAGGAVAAGTLSRFSQRGTTWEPWAPEQSSALVTDGPNAVSRNPMYLGMARAGRQRAAQRPPLDGVDTPGPPLAVVTQAPCGIGVTR